jgi:hypothetical protein
LGALREIPVPERTIGESVAGTGKEKDQARKVESFDDLWKLSSSEPNAIRDVYAFRDVFDGLAFPSLTLSITNFAISSPSHAGST